MNRYIAIAALALTTVAGAASAMTSDTDARQINAYAPSVDVSTLDNSTVLAAVQAIHGGGSEGEKAATVRAIVNAN